MTTLGISDNTTFQNGSPDSVESGVEAIEIKEETPTVVSASSSMEVTKYAAGFWTHSLIRAALTSVPSGAQIVSATLFLYEEGSGSNGGHTVAAYPLRRSWVEAEATWNVYSTGNGWGTAGAANTSTDRRAAISGSLTTTGVDGFRSLDVTDFVQAIANADYANEGLVLERSDGANDFEAARFSADNHSTDGQRPEILIEWSDGPTFNSGPTVDQITQGGARIRATGDLP